MFPNMAALAETSVGYKTFRLVLRGNGMDKPEAYRKKAEECLREAEDAPQNMRLRLVTIAQHWFDLAEHAERLRRESPENYQRSKDAPKS